VSVNPQWGIAVNGVIPFLGYVLAAAAAAAKHMSGKSRQDQRGIESSHRLQQRKYAHPLQIFQIWDATCPNGSFPKIMVQYNSSISTAEIDARELANYCFLFVK
jgi:hypothetical protein